MGSKKQGEGASPMEQLVDLLRRLIGLPPKPVLAPVPVRGNRR